MHQLHQSGAEHLVFDDTHLHDDGHVADARANHSIHPRRKLGLSSLLSLSWPSLRCRSVPPSVCVGHSSPVPDYAENAFPETYETFSPSQSLSPLKQEEQHPHARKHDLIQDFFMINTLFFRCNAPGLRFYYAARRHQRLQKTSVHTVKSTGVDACAKPSAVPIPLHRRSVGAKGKPVPCARRWRRLEVENFAGSGANEGFDAETTLALSSVIELGASARPRAFRGCPYQSSGMGATSGDSGYARQAHRSVYRRFIDPANLRLAEESLALSQSYLKPCGPRSREDTADGGDASAGGTHTF